MRGERPAKKTHYPHTGVRCPFCPERFSAQARSRVPQRNMVGVGNHSDRYRGNNHRVSGVQKQSKMVGKEWAP